MDYLFKNKPLLISLLVALVLIPLVIIFVSITNQPEKFNLMSVAPTDGAVLDIDNPVIVFEFNQELPLIQPSSFAVTIEPEVDFVYGILNNKIQVNISNLLLIESQEYSIEITNIVSRENEVVRNLSTRFTVNLEPITISYLNSLPAQENGFSVARISDRTLFVRITKEPEGRYKKSALELLNSKGLSPSIFNIDIGLPSEQSSFNENGIRD